MVAPTVTAICDAIARDDLAAAYAGLRQRWIEARSTFLADIMHALRARIPEPAAVQGGNPQKRWDKIEAAGEPLDVTRQVASLRDDGRQKVWRAGLEALAKRPPDPVLARALAQVVGELPWRSAPSLALYELACASIGAGGTPADAELVRRAAGQLEILDVAKLKTALARLFAATLSALEAPRVEASADAARELSAALAEYDTRAAARAARTEQLIAAVYANLEDDAPRLVLADHLAELGDARGELIALQCQGAVTQKQQQRIDHLIEQHGRAWLAELGERTILKDGLVYERGFVTRCRVRIYADAHDAVRSIGNRLWATVREVDLETGSAFEELLDPVCVSLRAVRNAPVALLEHLALTGRPLPVEVLDLYGMHDEHLHAMARLDPALLPRLRELGAGVVQDGAVLGEVLRRFPAVAQLGVIGRPRADLISLRGPAITFYDAATRARLTPDRPGILRIETWAHGWVHVNNLVPVPGLDRIELVIDDDGCDACVRWRRTPAALSEQFGCPVDVLA